MTQLDLAVGAETTTRHVSFLESGRSRPGLDLLARLIAVLSVPPTIAAEMIRTAGFAAQPVGVHHSRNSQATTVELLLSCHEPFPACAVDVCGSVLAANRSYLHLIPDALDIEPHDAIDRLFGAEGQNWIVNWEHVAWREADRRLSVAHQEADPTALELALRAHRLVEAAATGRATEGDDTTVLRLDDATVLTLRTVVLSPAGPQARWIELTLPADDDTDRWLRVAAAQRY